MKRILTALMLMGGVACSQATPVVTPLDGFRDPTAQIASQTDVTASRMDGNWVVRQSFAGQPGPVSGFELAALPDGALQWSYETGNCDDDVCTTSQALVLLEPRGPGRWVPVGEGLSGFDVELWVMWMDFDARTMAIGTPDGRFGFILDKNPTGGADRITAARDIMDWFGYDVSRLQEVRQ